MPQWLPVEGTPPAHLGLADLRLRLRLTTARMGHRESKPERGLSNEDIAFLVKNTHRSKKEIKVRPELLVVETNYVETRN